MLKPITEPQPLSISKNWCRIYGWSWPFLNTKYRAKYFHAEGITFYPIKIFLYTTCGIGSCLTQLSRSETGPGSPLPHTWGISHNHSLQITTCTVWLCHRAIHSSNFFPSKIAQVLTEQRLVCPYTKGAAGFLRELQLLFFYSNGKDLLGTGLNSPSLLLTQTHTHIPA